MVYCHTPKGLIEGLMTQAADSRLSLRVSQTKLSVMIKANQGLLSIGEPRAVLFSLLNCVDSSGKSQSAEIKPNDLTRASD